jgi:hypothetical protein
VARSRPRSVHACRELIRSARPENISSIATIPKHSDHPDAGARLALAGCDGVAHVGRTNFVKTRGMTGLKRALTGLAGFCRLAGLARGRRPHVCRAARAAGSIAPFAL